jgi:hypothetical protein
VKKRGGVFAAKKRRKIALFLKNLRGELLIVEIILSILLFFFNSPND